MSLLENTRSYINSSEIFIRTNRGVLQGGVLSPSLFNIYLDAALWENETLNRLIK